MRILITGSRDWVDEDLIYTVLRDLDREFAAWDPEAWELGLITLVSGACPTGADKIGEEVAEFNLAWNVERHPADWDTHGRRAGYVRNADMVELGADKCLAFIKNNSKGATMTANLAEKAGIETIRYLA